MTGKERGELLREIQRRLASFYGLEAAHDVVEFVREVDDGGRETLLVRECEDALELALLLPRRLLLPDAPRDDVDGLLQALEGVSHFVYLMERARTGLPTTQLELELQAEVDKFVLLALADGALETRARDRVCSALFDRVKYLHASDTEEGHRYRLANALAARFTRRLKPEIGAAELRRRLRRFYRAGQTEKIHLARAA